MQEQQTAPPAEQDRAQPEFDRRRGPRRATSIGDIQVGQERRQGDRRKKKPGFAGLLGAIFGHARLEETKN